MKREFLNKLTELSQTAAQNKLFSAVQEKLMEQADEYNKRIRQIYGDLADARSKVQEYSEANHELAKEVLSLRAKLQDERSRVVSLEKQVADLRSIVDECETTKAEETYPMSGLEAVLKQWEDNLRELASKEDDDEEDFLSALMKQQRAPRSYGGGSKLGDYLRKNLK